MSSVFTVYAWLFILLFIWPGPGGVRRQSASGQGVVGIERRWSQREKGHLFGISQLQGRGWASFQLAWQLYQGMCVTGGLGGAVHWASARRRSNVISNTGRCGVTPPLAHTVSSLFSPLLLLTASHCHLAMHVSCNAMCVPLQVNKVRCW